jgi:hypothetical protein
LPWGMKKERRNGSNVSEMVVTVVLITEVLPCASLPSAVWAS